MIERDSLNHLAGFAEMNDTYLGTPQPNRDGQGTIDYKVVLQDPVQLFSHLLATTRLTQEQPNSRIGFPWFRLFL